MCGICGYTGSSVEGVLQRMAEVIRHRGPDDAGFFSDGRVNLGMRRLSIIDLESGKQPTHNEGQTINTVFNGGICSYSELRSDLEKEGHRFYTDHPDTEVIVHLYEEHGLDFPNRMNGTFAIALWDSRKGRLILVRDRMGVKPLYYTVTGGRLIFASEIKAIQ